MRIGVVREQRAGEARVAVTPQVAGTLAGRGISVLVETDAGRAAGFVDEAYRGAGAQVVDRATAVDVDLVAQVGPPSDDLLQALAPGAAVTGFLEPFTNRHTVELLAERNLTGLAFEAVPRVTAAQGMDALSSQATAAGYAAVLLAATTVRRFLPMLTTAAGTIRPARALVLGAGVAGLQAIATARRLGAVVTGYDVRPEAAEQIRSLGAKAVEPVVDAAESTGYARELAEDQQTRQLDLLFPHVAEADVVITTAAIPGRPAPLLITTAMVEAMRAGSVIIDLAAATGGNCEVTRADESVIHNEVTVLGPLDLPSRVAGDASQMLARNVQAMLDRITDGADLRIDLDDEITSGSCVVHAGEVRHALSRALLDLEEPAMVAAPETAPAQSAPSGAEENPK